MEDYIIPEAYTLPTECCALNMLRATNLDTLEDLQQQVDYNKKWHERSGIKSFVGYAKGIGARALFCIVSPGETALESNLKKLGFEHTFSFGRRKGYNREGDNSENKFYILKW